MTEIPEGCVNVPNAGSIIDRPLLNTKWMLPNSTIVLSMWFIVIQIHVLCYVLWSPLPSMCQRIYVNCVTPFGVAVTGKLALIMDCISHPVLEEP